MPSISSTLQNEKSFAMSIWKKSECRPIDICVLSNQYADKVNADCLAIESAPSRISCMLRSIQKMANQLLHDYDTQLAFQTFLGLKVMLELGSYT